MVSYKELYLKTKKQLEELQSNSIDTRKLKMGNPIVFSKERYEINPDDNYILIEMKEEYLE